LIGLALIAAGSLVVVGSDFIASALKAFEGIPAISNVVSGLAWALIGLGIFLVVMGVLGGCGACCSIKVFLIGYVVVMIILIVAEITFVALLFSDTLKNLLSDPLTKEIKKYQPILDSGGNFNTDPQSRAMDLLFINGCYKAVIDLIEDNKPMTIGILVGLFVFQILCIVFAIWIVKDSSKINPVD
uniref:Tetraspanin n=1 Tax=Magallana gigas TaxID=29159 RepID=A0A8W8KRY0_MAGGI